MGSENIVEFVRLFARRKRKGDEIGIMESRELPGTGSTKLS
jgi:hypothetical protein